MAQLHLYHNDFTNHEQQVCQVLDALHGHSVSFVPEMCTQV